MEDKNYETYSKLVEELENMVTLKELYDEDSKAFSNIVEGIPFYDLTEDDIEDMLINKTEYKRYFDKYRGTVRSNAKKILFDSFISDNFSGLGYSKNDWSYLDYEPLSYWEDEFQVSKEIALKMKTAATDKYDLFYCVDRLKEISLDRLISKMQEKGLV